MSIFFGIVVIIVSFMILASVVILIVGPGMLLQPYRRTAEYYRKRTKLLHPSDAGLQCEELTLKSAEGINLSCWLIKAPKAAKGTVLFLHGVSENKIVGIPIARLLHSAGYNVFLYDSRRHGDSEGKYCTYGFYEKHDVRTIINYLHNRPDIRLGKVGLFGSSMGAAVAIQVAGIDNRIAAIIAESGFATLRTVFDDYQRRIVKLPWHYLRNIVIRRSEQIAHFKASAVSPLASITNVHIPIFMMHGTADDLIDHAYSQMLYENTDEPKELWLIPNARHDNMAEIGGDEYKSRILDFFGRTLAP